MDLKGLRLDKKTKPVVTDSEDSDQETQINFSSTKIEKKTKPDVVVKTGSEILEKFPHLAKFLRLVCDEPGCDFSTKYPENFEIHLESHQSNSESEDLLANYYSY
mgnify:CR=1 FL=1